MSKNLVIVESPAKAKTINKYLGKDFRVLASFGHVRDLPPKDGSVRPDEGFAMDWQIDARGKKTMKEIADAAKEADHIYLATDPDREGEAISWHVREILAERGLIKTKPVSRIAFNEITKSAVAAAIAHPRGLDEALIQAYLARRALDYLVGFTLSPVLWRRLPGAKSAGRVQSVALRLICEREAEIEIFKPQEYWSIEAELLTPDKESFIARLYALDGEKLDKLSITNEAQASAATKRIEAAGFRVREVARKQVRRNPYPPFITSTLQQEASSKLGFSATRTMRTAQRLYEGVDIGGETVGLITYMRTDGVTLSGEAVSAIRKQIEKDYGAPYLPKSPRMYKSKAKNAQEAHEAIRPTDITRSPALLARKLADDEYRLYELIWQRSMACQMESALYDQATITLASGSGDIELRASGSILLFEGYQKVYREKQKEEETRLPEMEEGDNLTLRKVEPEQHFTQPPPRYGEASLVKKMEELGIGRPSTYASIMQVLQDRGYVRLEKRRFVPEDLGRMLSAFLSNFFARYVEYDFTAALEEQLDDITAGSLDWKAVLTDFWTEFLKAVESTKELRITNVIDALDETLGPHFFPIGEDGRDPRICPSCGGRLGLKLGKTGGFIGCSNYPDCTHTRPLEVIDGETAQDIWPKKLGMDPQTDLPVSLHKGRFGPYVQLGPAEGETLPKGEKPPRASLMKSMAPDEVTLEIALKLLSLPRVVGQHPEDQEPIEAGLGRYGPFLRHGKLYANLPDEDSVFTIGLDHAVTLLAEKAKSGKGSARGAPAPLREIGAHPEDGEIINLYDGRYGPYVKHGKINASLGKADDPAAVTLERAVELIEARRAKTGGKEPTKTKTKRKAKS